MAQKKEQVDVSAKLNAPVKKSLFERQRAEAEAKRQKEQEETAAVYEDFVKSFDNDEDDIDSGALTAPPPSVGGFSKRHFSAAPGPSARGGLGRGRGISGPGTLPPVTSSLPRKRPFDDGPPNRTTYQKGMFAYDEPDSNDAKAAFRDSDEEEGQGIRSKAQEKAAPKPTLHLSSLPPGTSAAVVKALVPMSLNVDTVRFLAPSGPGDRRSTSAIVTLAKDTPAGDLDTAVSALQNRYLGWGFYLSISRHLSSAVMTSNLATGPGLSNTTLPFGAKPIQPGSGLSLSRAPPPGPHRGGFAPPASYGPSGAFNRGMPPVQVNVKPPTDLKQLKLIHKTIESLVTHGPEFEALLMSRPVVQREEQWAWIWDSRSHGGVYYRWRLWDILTNAQKRIRVGNGRNDDSVQNVFDSGASWAAPEEGILPFEYTTSLEEFVSDSDYNSSEDEDSGDEGRRRLQHLQGSASMQDPGAAGEADLPAYLNPLHKAKLIHLLTRLPKTIAKLRRGDVARVTAFAISHAGAGADEVVTLLTANILRPFNLVESKSQNEHDSDSMDDDDRDQPAYGADRALEKDDPSPCKLIALYLISDILSTSSTSGVRHAWRYRSLFETSLRASEAFAHLGRLEKELGWGKLRAEKWRRSVTTLLSLWEGWCVFPAKAQEDFVEQFTNPPLSETERKAAEREDVERADKEKAKKRWKAVGQDEANAGTEAPSNIGAPPEEDIDGEAIDEDVDGEPMVGEEADIDGEPMEDGDLDGEPMDDVTNDKPNELGQADESYAAADNQPRTEAEKRDGNAAAASRRRRPRAEDMFADSDGD